MFLSEKKNEQIIRQRTGISRQAYKNNKTVSKIKIEKKTKEVKLHERVACLI